LERPGSALIGSVVVHAAIIGAVLLALTVTGQRPERQIVSTIPVSILSEDVVLAGPADAPSEDPAVDAAAAPPLEAPEPPPPTPTPVPTPRPPEKAPAPRPTPRPTPTRPVTPPPAKKETPRPREEPRLDLGALAADRPNRSPNRTPARPSGQQSTGTAGQTSGPVITAMFNQVYQNWNPPCQTPGASDLRIQMDVTLDARGRITDGPTLVGARNDPVWRAVAAGAMQALVRTAPFDVPAGFTGGEYRPSFNMERACGG
jgi:outer membrane biosynthesis protein TonB